MRPWLFPESQEREYTRILIRLARFVSRETMARLAARRLLQRRNDAAEMRQDDWLDELSHFLLELAASFLEPGQQGIFRLRDAFTGIARFNDRQWRLQVRAGTGVDIGPSGALPKGAAFGLGSTTDPQRVRAVFGMGVDVYRSEPWLEPMQRNWVANNTKLIKSIPEKYLGDVEQVIRTGVMQGRSQKWIAEELQRVSDVSEKRAKFIAADQVGKANGALTMHRQTDLGVRSYQWMDSDDRKVRPTHKIADGQIYHWDKPPTITGGNHPGMEIRCRCWARPILAEVMAKQTARKVPESVTQ